MVGGRRAGNQSFASNLEFEVAVGRFFLGWGVGEGEGGSKCATTLGGNFEDLHTIFCQLRDSSILRCGMFLKRTCYVLHKTAKTPGFYPRKGVDSPLSTSFYLLLS